MVNALTIAVGFGSVLMLGVLWQWFQVDTYAVNVPLALAVWVAVRRDVGSAYLVAFVLGLLAATVSPGPRGALLLSLALVVLVTWLSRTRVPVHQPSRLAGWVIAASLLCDLSTVLILLPFGGGSGGFSLFWHLSPVSALLTGLYALLLFPVLARLEQLLQQRQDRSGLLPR